MMKQRKKSFNQMITVLMMAGIFILAVMQNVMAYQGDPAMNELSQTKLGKLAPGAWVDWKIFIEAAVPYLTFEQGEDPIRVAEKQHYVPKIYRGAIHREDALNSIFRMTGAVIPQDGDIVKVAQDWGIIPARDVIFQMKKGRITAAEACAMLVNTRRAWYRQLDAAAPAERFDALNYYFAPTQFSFSADGRYLRYNEKDVDKVMKTGDGTITVSPDRPQPPPKELFPTQAGEDATCVYDNAGVLRAVSIEVSPRKNDMIAKYILYRDSPDKPWRHLIDFNLAQTRDFEIAGFTSDNQHMYVKTNFYDNYVTLYDLDPKTMERRLLYRNPQADVVTDFCALVLGIPVSSLRHPRTGRILAAFYVNDKARVVCLDPKMKTLMAKVEADLGADQYPVTITRDCRYLVLMHRDDRDVRSFRLYDSQTRTVRLIAAPNIPVKDVGHTYPVSFRASDGNTVFAYLTLPLGKSPRNLPLLVNAHGGPQSRYSRTPDSYALLASNLGAAVLSVDFRFSLGYGNAYTDAGSRNKLLAQQDIFEACQWAIARGIANPRHIGVMGHSYGGYSAFYQAAVHPDVYQAAIAMMGIWNWTDLGVELTNGQPVPDYHKCSAPEPGTELAKIMSPSTYVRQLECPMLIVYSGKDEAVYPSQNIRAIGELTAAGNIPQVLYLPDLGHVPCTVASINAINHAITDFLTTKFLNAP